jgi:hypothetical protein
MQGKVKLWLLVGALDTLIMANTAWLAKHHRKF